MNIIPKEGPHIVKPTTATPSNLNAAKEARARAIAMVKGEISTPTTTQAQQTPVSNPSKVTAEEMTAIRPLTPTEVKQTNGQGDTIETTATQPESKSTVSEEEESLSSHYANLARREKAQRARAAQLKAKEEALKAKEEQLTKTPTIDTSKFIEKDSLIKNPLQTLADLGLSYEQITELALNAPKAEDLQRQAYEARIEAELKAIKEQQEANKKFYEDQQAQAYNQAVTQIRTEAKQLISGNPEFELIQSTNSVNDVVELIEKTFREDNVLLTVEEASQAVEDYLVEQATRLAKAKKIQSRLKPAEVATKAPSSEEKPNQVRPAQANQIKTLTNDMTTSRKLSAKERAILAFKGELNNK